MLENEGFAIPEETDNIALSDCGVRHEVDW